MKNDNMTEKQRKRYLSKDNSRLGRTAFISTFPFMFISMAPQLLEVAIVVLIMAIAILSFNIYQIYIIQHPKYKSGHSFVKRKRKVLGGILFIVKLIMSLVLGLSINSLSELPESLLIVINFTYIAVWFYASDVIIARIWQPFDKRLYQEIDGNNPYQKTYFYETRDSWNDGNPEKIDLELFKDNHDKSLKKAFKITSVVVEIIIVLAIIGDIILKINFAVILVLISTSILIVYIFAIYVDRKLFLYIDIYAEQSDVPWSQDPTKKTSLISILLLISIILATPVIVILTVVNFFVFFPALF